MDRNGCQGRYRIIYIVALRKESVDRNPPKLLPVSILIQSLSARRAWIEISGSTKPKARREVALRKESVDRNAHSLNLPSRPIDVALRKESVDRNITSRQLPAPKPPVALRKESVDRNSDGSGCLKLLASRSPQGERG